MSDGRDGRGAVSATLWRGRGVLSPSWLDVKLGLRMLVKHPVLTLVAIFALSIGIPVGLLPLHIVDSYNTPLPVENGEDIVALGIRDLRGGRNLALPLRDLAEWNAELASFEGIGAVRWGSYNVVTEGGAAVPVRGAEVTASVFSILRIPPLLGRPLNEADGVVGAPDAVVIGHDLWQARLGGDPGVVGSTIRVRGVPRTVVGVMPPGFLFPFRDHLWLPLRDAALEFRPGSRSIGRIMGRIAPGASTEEARVELELVAQRRASEFPEAQAPLRAWVSPYTAVSAGFGEFERRAMLNLELLALLVLGIACGNVGILILARAATRTREMAIRTALGASRLRIVSQLFVESLVLAVLAAGAGLLIGQAMSMRLTPLVQPYLPFWVDFGVTTRTVVLAMSLAVFSAVVAGVVPALKATAKSVQDSIQRASGGASGIRFGAAPAVLTVAEVAVAVLALSVLSTLAPAVLSRPGGFGIDADRYLSASLRIPWVESATRDPDAAYAAFESRTRTAHQELTRRLAAEPGFGQVAIASRLPGMDHRTLRVEMEGEALPIDPSGHRVQIAAVDVGYFEALGRPVLSGRGFSSADLDNRSAVVVNESFVARVLDGRNPLGLRVRYTAPSGFDGGPWWEIVGVVGRLGMNRHQPEIDEGIYRVAAPGEMHPVRFAVRIDGDPEQMVPRLRAIAAEIDPGAMIEAPLMLDEIVSDRQTITAWLGLLVTLLSAVAVVLSTAGLYALMSFTVAERTREIGIRTALGAPASSIVSTIASRAFLQLAVGVVVGLPLSAWMMRMIMAEDEVFFYTANWEFTVALIALAVVVVGALACAPPTRRGLRVQPAEALRAE